MADDPSLYVQVDTLKASLKLQNADAGALADLLTAATAASRAVDTICDRRFYKLDASNDEVRYYTPTMPLTLMVDDLLGLTSVKADRDGDGTYELEWTRGQDFLLGPLNAQSDGHPWEWIRLRNGLGITLPLGVEAGVEVTGRFGWNAPPGDIVAATQIIAEKIFKRIRDNAFPVIGIGVDGAAVQIGRYDAEVQILLSNFDRNLRVF